MLPIHPHTNLLFTRIHHKYPHLMSLSPISRRLRCYRSRQLRNMSMNTGKSVVLKMPASLLQPHCDLTKLVCETIPIHMSASVVVKQSLFGRHVVPINSLLRSFVNFEPKWKLLVTCLRWFYGEKRCERRAWLWNTPSLTRNAFFVICNDSLVSRKMKTCCLVRRSERCPRKVVLG